jgi:hypothetical protein
MNDADYEHALQVLQAVQAKVPDSRAVRAKLYRRLRAEGWSLRRIGDAVGLSGERIRQVLLDADRRQP